MISWKVIVSVIFAKKNGELPIEEEKANLAKGHMPTNSNYCLHNYLSHLMDGGYCILFSTPQIQLS